MQKEFGTNPKDIFAGIGPSIGSKVYEVGQEVVDQFNESFGMNYCSTPVKNSRKAYLDLWKANKKKLLDSGIRENQIEIAEICTYSNPGLFYSARRDGGKTGRLVTGIIIIE